MSELNLRLRKVKNFEESELEKDFSEMAVDVIFITLLSGVKVWAKVQLLEVLFEELLLVQSSDFRFDTRVDEVRYFRRTSAKTDKLPINNSDRAVLSNKNVSWVEVAVN